MADIHPEFEAEQEYIEYAGECLESEISHLIEHPVAESGGDRHAARALKKTEIARLEALEAARAGVCVGRIDPKGEQPLYIGHEALRDDGDMVTLSWQAPKAAAFYRAKVGDPQGLAARRSFVVEGTRLLAIDEVVFERAREQAKAGPVSLGDALLAELERSRSSEMRDIVATIQADQYAVIESSPDGALVVQGGPGTGKTAVGLHRASWLLYNHRERLERQGVLIVGPNRAFMDYIGHVLPALRQTSVDQSSVDRLTSLRPRQDDVLSVQHLKGDARMATVLRRESQRRVTVPDSAIVVTDEGRRYTLEPDEVKELLAELTTTDAPYMQRRGRFREAFAAALVTKGAARRVTGPDSTTLMARLKSNRDFINGLERVWPTLSARQLVHEVLTGPRRLADAARDVLTPAEQAELRRADSPLEQARWTLSDVALVDEAEAIVAGIRERYGHVIVDEAQDLTPMQVRMVGRRAIDGSLTVLGDLAQATGPWRWKTWEELVDVLPGQPDARLETLTTGYRVPAEVLELARPVLIATGAGVNPPVSVREYGASPEIARVSAPSLPVEVAQRASALSSTGETVGIIAPSILATGIRDASDGLDIEVTDLDEGRLGDSVSLLSPRQAKGLEFDHVIVVEPAEVMRDDAAGASLLYVALTRPTKTLSIVHSEPLPAEMTSEAPADGGHVEIVPKPEFPVRLSPTRLVEAIALASLFEIDDEERGARLASALEAAASEFRRGAGEPAAATALLQRLRERSDGGG